MTIYEEPLLCDVEETVYVVHLPWKFVWKFWLLWLWLEYSVYKHEYWILMLRRKYILSSNQCIQFHCRQCEFTGSDMFIFYTFLSLSPSRWFSLSLSTWEPMYIQQFSPSRYTRAKACSSTIWQENLFSFRFAI